MPSLIRVNGFTLMYMLERKMETVVILGASYGQLELISECRKLGYYIIAVTPKGDYPGLKFVNEIVYENVKNVDSIYEQIRNKNVKAILHDQLDIAVTSAAYLSTKLGIKGITNVIAERFTNKSLMREFAERAGVAVPKSIVLQDKKDIKDAISDLHFPLIMKPLDSSASHGVCRVENYGDIYTNFEQTQSFSNASKVIIEEFIEGQEYVVEAFTRGFITYNLVIGKRSYFRIPNTFIPNMTLFKSANPTDGDIEQKLCKANLRLIASMELEYGMTHAEFIYNPIQNKVYLVEIAARGGGVKTSTEAVPAACGVNFTKLYVDEALGLAPDEIILKKGYSAYVCFILPEGKIIDLSGIENINAIDGVISSQLSMALNSCTPPIVDKYARQGPIIVRGDSEQDCILVRHIIKKTLNVSVKTADGIKGIIWD